MGRWIRNAGAGSLFWLYQALRMRTNFRWYNGE